MFDFQKISKNQYDRITLANHDDNGAILDFFSTIVIDTEVLQLRYDRGPNFFTFLDIQGLPAVVFLFKNDDGSIGGIVSLSTRNCLMNGKNVFIGYAGDLRVSPKISRKTRIHWRRMFIEIIANYRSFPEMGHLDYIYAVIMDDNKNAIQAFIKPEANPVCRKIVSFNSINILGQTFRPVHKCILRKKVKQEGYVFSWADNDDLPALKAFLYKENKEKSLGTDYTESGNGELERRLHDWTDFTISSFLLVRQNEKIIACMAPWSNGGSRRLVVEKAPLSLRIIGALLPLCGQRAIKTNDELKVLYLTSLEVDSGRTQEERANIFGLMIDYIFIDNRCRKYNVVSFLDSANCSFAARAIQGRGYIYYTQQAAIYQFLSPEENQAERFLSVNDGQLVGLELAIS